MPRTAGAKNRSKDIAETMTGMSNEDKFLAELISGKARWTKTASDLAKEDKDNGRELDYAGAYKVLINKFTNEST